MKRKTYLAGAIAGDVIGSVYEFDNIKTKDFPLFHPMCEYTDDTVMTLALAKTLSEMENREDLEEFKLAYVQNMHFVFRLYPDMSYGGRFLRWLEEGRTTPYNSCGNGSAMRVSAVGWYANTLEEAERLAKASAEVTHNHPDGIAGAVATAGAVFLARTGATKERIREYVSGYYPLDFTLAEIRPDYEFNEVCCGTVPQAVVAFLEAEDFEDAIRNVISIGGDSDTLGAITGAIAEAYYGIPEELEQTALSYLDDYLLDLAESFAETLPQE